MKPNYATKYLVTIVLSCSLFLAIAGAPASTSAPRSLSTGVSTDSPLIGEWVLTKIEAPGSFIRAKKAVGENSVSYPVSSEGSEVIVEEEVSLQPYLEKQLIIGTTRFIFHANNEFQFYKTTPLKHAGTWLKQNSELTFEYSNGSTKVNTVEKLTEELLVIGSYSQNLPIKLYFKKRK